MPRHLLPSLTLLSALVLGGPALAVEPARHSADGGCPAAAAEADAADATTAPVAGPETQSVPAPASSQPPQRRTLSSGERTRVPLRWHSFVPGMFM